MTPEQLRASILQYAMEGKLVKQDPSDEPASELIKKIENKKAELIKEGKIKKSKKLPAITDDEKPFDIPDSWEWVRLDTVLDVRDGTHDTPKYVENGIPLITSKNISNGHLDFSNIKYISEKDFTEINKRSNVEKGDIIFAMIGSIGNPVIVDTDRKFGIKNVALLKNINHSLDMNFVLHYLYLLENLWIKNASGAVQKFISLKKIRASLIPFPPLEEQRRIVAKIEKLMSLVDEYAESYNRLQKIDNEFEDKLKQSVLQYAMEGKLVKQNPSDEPASELIKKIENEKAELIKEGKIKKSKKLPSINDDEKPFDIPDSWEWVRLGNITIYQNGYAYKSSQLTKIKRGLPVIKSQNIMTLNVVIKDNNDYVEQPNDRMLRSQINKGDLLMCLSSQSQNPEPLGKTAIYNLDEPALLNQRVLKLKLIDQSMTKLVFYFINSPWFHYTVSHKGSGSGQSNLKLNHVRNMLLPVPPLEEQKRIVTKIEELMTSINKISK